MELNKELTIIEEGVLQCIPLGSERKVAIKELSSLVDLDERSIYEVINRLRKKGIPVCAQRSGKLEERGYYIATNEQERSEGLAAYKSQVQDMSKLIEDIEAAELDTWQQRLYGA
ncbi:hypothetical protein [Candidatus Enterococcus courvalinii]|uniref:Helix-turn-helix type 11 domain-containing protein n=1 Tax=Candidatus Enterococcus courvalinii TaxID=2815329 RepID=A0ABS3HZB5_9ENTE|nr:hypothetical protein [Enterococcus sp. MSG2901]MBO0481811.1 hypothetical protein [Enterococcus sp. MSG2901]